MQRADVAIIGAGQAGLATSACLTERGIDHVVIERARVAERWRSASWDSLRLLTPNWLNELPGWPYAGCDPCGFMSKDEIVDSLMRYAAAIHAPVVSGNEVVALESLGANFRIAASRGAWLARAVVIATGQCQTPHVPVLANRLSPAVFQLTAAGYRRPDTLPPGGVLVVGASASGIQIAEEIHRSGRPVTLSVGRHTRLPRRYRGHDIFWWLERLGILDDAPERVRDLDRVRRHPSLQLVGRHRLAPSLAALRRSGVRVVGRAIHADAVSIAFAGDLAETTTAADRTLSRLVERIDDAIAERGLAAGRRMRIAPTVLESPAARINLRQDGIATVIWATGYRRRYPWLKLPVLDARGEIAHAGGVTAKPGLYVLGLPWLRRRSSSFIAGTARDAAEISGHIDGFLRQSQSMAA